MGENVRNGNDDIESNGRIFQEIPSEVVATMRSLIKAKEEHHQLNAAMLQSLTDLQRKIDSRRGIARPTLGGGEGLPVDHLTLKNTVEIQAMVVKLNGEIWISSVGASSFIPSAKSHKTIMVSCVSSSSSFFSSSNIGSFN